MKMKPSTTDDIVRAVRSRLGGIMKLRAERISLVAVFDPENTPDDVRLATERDLRARLVCTRVEMVPHSGNIVMVR